MLRSSYAYNIFCYSQINRRGDHAFEDIYREQGKGASFCWMWFLLYLSAIIYYNHHIFCWLKVQADPLKVERHNRFAKEGKFSFYLNMNRYLDVDVCFLYLPTNILFANSNGPNNQRFADMLSVEVTSMMNGYRWDWDTANMSSW